MLDFDDRERIPRTDRERDAISSGVPVAALLSLKTSLKPAATPVRRRLWADVLEGLVWVRDQRFIRATLPLTSGANALLTGIYLLVILVARNGGASPAAIGLIFTVEALFAIAGTILAPILPRSSPPVACRLRSARGRSASVFEEIELVFYYSEGRRSAP